MTKKPKDEIEARVEQLERDRQEDRTRIAELEVLLLNAIAFLPKRAQRNAKVIRPAPMRLPPRAAAEMLDDVQAREDADHAAAPPDASKRLYKRGAVWWCWFYDAAGKYTRKSTKCMGRDAARAVLERFEREAHAPARPQVSDEVAEMARRALEKHGITDEMAEEARRMLEARGLLPARPEHAATPDDVELAPRAAKRRGLLRPPRR